MLSSWPRWIVVLSFLFCAGGAQAAVGFSRGDQFTAYPIQGNVDVQCPNNVNVHYFCRDSVLEPSAYDYFVGPAGVTADQVDLINIRADGSRKEKVMNYEQGRGTDSVNLWISTLFQSPFLQIGLNQVSYTLILNSKPVVNGIVNVGVAHGDLRVCPTTRYNSQDSGDCESQYSVCQRYFQQFDGCR